MVSLRKLSDPLSRYLRTNQFLSPNPPMLFTTMGLGSTLPLSPNCLPTVKPEVTMPKHVAVILDGNRRWCKARGIDLTYEPVFRKSVEVADFCIKWDIPTLSCFLFATCTWKRSLEANTMLFRQLETSLENNLEKFTREGIRLSVIGEKAMLPKSLQGVIKQVEEATKKGTRLDLMYAVSYGGRWDLVQAARSISEKVKAGVIDPEDVNEDVIQQELSTRTSTNPNPDLMIRTGGNQRVSNFLLWQMSHTELYFTDVMAPDFEEAEFIDALRWFQHCERRFGK